jgi:LmbE family N-acetylglucosaminyl deacetylase
MNIVGIFAHPDDESFCCGGTLAQLAQENNIYNICATKGEAGLNYSGDKNKQISEIREKELKEASSLLGVKDVFFLGFEDGTLSNNLYHALAEKTIAKLEELKPERIITLEPRGVTGHIDHIVMSMVSSYVFNKLDFIKEMWYFCLSEEQRKLKSNDYFVFRPPGYKASEISLTLDVSDYCEAKIKAMKSHVSQIENIQKILSRPDKILKEENFIIIKK